MDLTSIEATSVAIRAGQVAAAELANLLLHEDEDQPTPIEDWFDPRGEYARPGEGHQQQIEQLGAAVDRLGGYVCHSADPVSGERLYRWAVHEGIARLVEWADLPFGRRQAFEVFAATTRAVYVPLKAEQTRLEAIGKEPPHQLGLALADSIFEPEETLGTMRPEAIAAAPLISAYHTAQAAEAAAAPKAKPAPREKAAKPYVPLSNALSVGEAPVAPPVNRGGRGNTKTR
jgi:hypothetical protein